MEPIDIQSRVAAQATCQHRPQGVSVLVAVPAGITALPERLLCQAALELAAQQYPSERLTGRVLHVGLHALGRNQHEVVVEVQP